MASNEPPNALQLKDVYSVAQLVGEQFQKLITRFGNTYTADLVDTVIGALEHLEGSVEEVNRLKTRLCKLLLENDNLVKEKEKIKVDLQNNAATLAMKEQENERLKQQLEDTHLRNEILSTHQPADSLLEENSVCGNGGDFCDGRVSEEESKSLPLTDDSAADPMELPRMKQRLQQMENELRRTRIKLLNFQATMKCIVTENNTLKSELEESKAVMGLQALQLTRSEHVGVNYCGPGHQESPKFFKKDLLAVLRERNELKEEIDSLRDELNMTRLQLYRPLPPPIDESGTREASFNRSRVRTIVTSITLQEQRNKQYRKLSRKSTS